MRRSEERVGGDRLLKSILSLLTSSATGALLGLVFWAVTAHLYPERSVGYGAAAIAAMTLLASVAQLNLAIILPRYLYPAGAHARIFLIAGYAASAGLAVIVSVLFLVLTGHHSYVGRGMLSPALFVAAVVLWVIFTIQDGALIGLRAAVVVPVENTTFSLVKIALLPLFALVAPVSGVFLAWTLPVIVCIVGVNFYLFHRALPEHHARTGGVGVVLARRVAGSVLAGEYVGSLSFIALTALPALIVLATLGPVQTAYFQTPWLVGTSFDLLLFGVATALLAESSAHPARAADYVPKAVRVGALLLLPSSVVLVIVAPKLLSLLGPRYAAHGTDLLRWLAVALPFMGVNVLYVTFARLGRRMRRVVTMQLSLAVLILALTWVLITRLGITGAGLAFAAGQCAVACAVTPSVVRQYRRTGMAPGFAPSGALVRAMTDTVNVTEG